MNNSIRPDFITLEFLEETPYKGEIREIGEQVEVDGSYAKNFIAQGRAVAIETSDDSNDKTKSDLDALKEKFSGLTVEQMAKERKDYLVASAYNLGIPTVPDGLKNKDIAQLIYDHVHGKSE